LALMEDEVEETLPRILSTRTRKLLILIRRQERATEFSFTNSRTRILFVANIGRETS
jgi:hypothetical protein